MTVIQSIRKRDGRVVPFHDNKIADAINKAFAATYKPGYEDTAASLALESGAGIKEISELMGHSDIGTTSRFYAALTAEAKRRTVEGIGGLLFPSRQDEQS